MSQFIPPASGRVFLRVNNKTVRRVIGIDEVGRGSLAGPVVVAALCVPHGFRFGVSPGKLRDSKKLTPKKREEWFRYLRSHPKISYATARVYQRKIEQVNISTAANIAASRAFRRLLKLSRLRAGRLRTFLDGGLYLHEAHRGVRALTVTKGDEKIPVVKAASIVAKVSRDAYMVRLAKRFPQYGFDAHKGYGTARHLEALRKHGPSEVHRLTFLPRIARR